MNNLAEQCERLRSWARQFDERADIDVLSPLLANDLREAAETILSLHGKLQAAELGNGTCHDKNGFDESIGFECTSCETTVDSYMQTTTSDKVEQFRHCPNCGRNVVRV